MRVSLSTLPVLDKALFVDLIIVVYVFRNICLFIRHFILRSQITILKPTFENEINRIKFIIECLQIV